MESYGSIMSFFPQKTSNNNEHDHNTCSKVEYL